MGDRSNINLVGNTTQGQNVGSGTTVFKGKSIGNILQYKTVSSLDGTTIKITNDADNIYLSGATGGGGGGLSATNNGLCDNGTTVGLGGTLSDATTTIAGGGNSLSLPNLSGMAITGTSFFAFRLCSTSGNACSIQLDAQTSTVKLIGCAGSFLAVGNGVCLDDSGGSYYLCNLPAKSTETNVLYVAANGKVACGAAGGGGGLATVNNGLTAYGDNVVLGGNLTGDTSIGMNNKDLFILDADNCGLVVSTTGATTCVDIGDTGEGTLNNYLQVRDDCFIAKARSSVNGCFGLLYLTSNGNFLCHNNSGNTAIRNIVMQSSSGVGIRLSASDNAGNATQMNVSDGCIFVSGSKSVGGFAGIEYGGDYSDNYVARSIPDAAWVTGQTGGGGLAVSGVTDTSVTTYINASGDLCAQPNLKFNGTTLAIAANMAFCSGADRYITISNTTSAPSRHLLICAQQYHGFETSGDVSGGRVCLCGGFGNNTSESGGSGTGGDAHIFGGTGKIHTGSATGGDVLICGGWGWVTTSGTGTGGTVHLCGGDGDTIGRIRLSGLPSKVSETCVVWIDASGNLSTATPASDSRLKCCVTPISSATSMLSGICGYSAEFNNLSNCEGCCEYVFLAQEVEKELPLAVKNGVIINEVDYKKIEYDQLIPVMWNIIKEQEARIQALESK